MEKMTKDEVIAAIEQGRAEWDALLATIPQERMLEPGVGGGEWSVKDHIAHNLWNEAEMVRLMREHALLPSESDRLWMMDNDTRNAEIHRMYRDVPPDELIARDRGTHAQLMDALQPLTDDDMNDPARFPGMPPDWVPWDILAGCTFRHYPEHIETIREWPVASG